MVTSRALERQGPWSFSLAPSDSVEADFIAAYVDTMGGVSRVALLYHNDEFGIGLRDALVRAVEARGIEVVDERFFPPTTVPATSQDRVPTMLRAALLAEPDGLVLALREVDTKMVVAVLRERGVRIPLVASDASWVTVLPRGEPRFEGLKGLHLVRFWGEDWNPQAAAFAERFTARFGYPPDHGEALTYDALMLVASAIDFGARSAQEIRSYLLGLGTRAPAFEGVAGPYVFEDGRPRVVRRDVRARIFDSFFTTREGGIGLGLAVSRGAVRRAGGNIHLDDVTVGTGASFTIKLPVATGTGLPDFGTEAPVLGPEFDGVSILVVDDEELIRRVLARYLETLGADVEMAGGGAAALRALDERVFDIVILDLRMPDLDGLTVYRTVAHRHPDLADRTIFLSGDISQLGADLGVPAGRILLKPVELDRLHGAVADVLDRAWRVV